MGIENVSEVAVLVVGNREVTETLEVFLEFRHAADVASLLGVFKASEIMPRGVVSIGSYDRYLFRCDSGGKTRKWKKTEKKKEEEEGIITKQRKHSFCC